MGNPAGLHILQDSGPPKDSTDYTTVFLLHGFALQSGIFAKLIPLAHHNNARVVLVNRRDYPGAAPLSAEDRAVLEEAVAEKDAGVAQEKLVPFMKERAREVYDLLTRFVAEHHVPRAHLESNTGGIVVVGWSFGTVWMIALLAHAASFPVDDIDLSTYVRRVIFHDPPFHVLGFAPPPDPYNPLFDPAIAPEDSTRVFSNWVSGYYQHGDSDSPDAFERRTPLASPPPTLSTFTAEEAASIVYPDPGNPGGSDSLLVASGMQSGLWVRLREDALRLLEGHSMAESGDSSGSRTASVGWEGVEVRYVWCDSSVWEIVWGVRNLRGVLEGRKDGQRYREVKFLRLRGSNHFVHWDEPERALEAFLVNSTEIAQ